MLQRSVLFIVGTGSLDAKPVTNIIDGTGG